MQLIKLPSCHSQVLDGPSCTLLEYMRTHNFQAPIGWQGYRVLVEK